MSRASIVVQSLTISDGTVVELPNNGVVLIVGPNNSGKSQALRDISRALTSKADVGIVVRSAETQVIGTADDLVETSRADRSIGYSSTGSDTVLLSQYGQSDG